MPLYRQSDLRKLFQAVENGEVSQAYLLFGERFLCQETANGLIQRLLPDDARRSHSVKMIDGEKEDIAVTLNMLKTYSLFGGRQVIRVIDSRLFQSRSVALTFWEKAEQAQAAKEPAQAARYLARMLALADLRPSDWQEEVAACSAERWQSLFGFPRPDDLKWVQEILSMDAPIQVADQRADAGDLLLKALEQRVPSGNILILIAEAVDKRKRLYKFFEKNCAVIDLSVETGSTAAARKEQDVVLRDLVYETLSRFGKKIDPKCLPILFERIGFYPVAIVMETEKLALAVGEAPTITLADLDAMVSRTREEALYELLEALGELDLPRTLLILKRLREQGLHALAIVAGLRNFLRKLLLARACQEQQQPKYPRGISYPAFQKGYLPSLQETAGKIPEVFSGHPFVVYKLFRQAELFSLPALKKGLEMLLLAEYRLKGSQIPEHLILEDLIFSLLTQHQQSGSSGR